MIKELEDCVMFLLIGFLINIVLVLIKVSEMKENIEEIIFMGGGIFGNWMLMVEFNIWVDSEVVKKVFDSGILLVVMGLDIIY